MPADEMSIAQRTTATFQLHKTNQITTAELTVKYPNLQANHKQDRV